MSFESQKTSFLKKLLETDTFDREGVHHEFNQGLHGQKIDFKEIEDDSDLFWLWVKLVADAIVELYPEAPDVLVGVGKGTNRIISPVSQRLSWHPLALETAKIERSSPVLTEVSRKAIQRAQPGFVLVIEDVASVGTNTLSVVRSIQEAGVEKVEVLNTLQRSPELELLRANGISYRSILTHVLPTYTKEECEEHGFCAQGWKLIPYRS